MLYFTSDLHLGHSPVLKFRPMFTNAEEMDEALIKNWNDTVSDEDTVVIVGDLFGRKSVPDLEKIRRLNGKKILVRGNHEKYWLDKFEKEELDEVFDEICDFYRIDKDGYTLFFCHYPMVSWEYSRKGSLLICGHMHARKGGYEYEMFRNVPCALNAGIDLNGMRPVTLSQLLQNNDKHYGRRRFNKELEILHGALGVFG